MQEAFGHPYASGGLKLPAGNYVAFEIGEDSDFDQVRINGRLLRAGRVLSLKTSSPIITYERGPVIGITKGATTSTIERAKYQAHVVGYECGDFIPAGGPRASRIYREFITLTANTWFIRRVPFSGRRHGHVRIAYATGTVLYYVQGVHTTDQDTERIFNVESLFAGNLSGTAAAPNSVAATADDANSGAHNGEGVHVGGTNDAEYFDELFVVLKCVAGCDVVLEVETAGEEGVA